MNVYKLLQTVLGIKNKWYGKHPYNNDTIHLPKPIILRMCWMV
jgi:hypothetical protein